jgi:hypothetical protein
MLRIVGVRKGETAEEEFVLLQNQGGLKVNLRGHVLLGEKALELGDVGDFFHLFTDDVSIGAGHFVLLYTGCGTPKWAKTKEQQLVYYTFMNRFASVWDRANGAVHILSPQHSFTERRDALVLR